MLLNVLTGLPIMILCLLLQAVFVTICLRRYLRFRPAGKAYASRLHDIQMLSIVMLLMLLANFVQTIVWAALFMSLNEFTDFRTALYFSGVNFSTLGYGDIILSDRWRLLGPLEAANGILMFGVSTAVMTAAVADIVRRSRPEPSNHGHKPRETAVEA